MEKGFSDAMGNVLPDRVLKLGNMYLSESNSKIYTCSLCDKYFTAPHLFWMHLKSHQIKNYEDADKLNSATKRLFLAEVRRKLDFDDSSSEDENESSPKKIKYKYIFGIRCPETKKYNEIALKIQELGGEVCKDDGSNYDSTCTHLICDRLRVTEGLLCCIAAGKWVLSMQYVLDSYEKKKFIEEEPYEWGSDKRLTTLPTVQQKDKAKALAAHRWRKQLMGDFSNSGAFAGFKVILCIKGESHRIMNSLLLAGKAEIINSEPPFTENNYAHLATHCLVDTDHFTISWDDYQFLKRFKIHVLSYNWLLSYLIYNNDYKIFEVKLFEKTTIHYSMGNGAEEGILPTRKTESKLGSSNIDYEQKLPLILVAKSPPEMELEQQSSVPLTIDLCHEQNVIKNELSADISTTMDEGSSKATNFELNFEQYVQFICPECGLCFDTDSVWKDHIHKHHDFYDRDKLQFTQLTLSGRTIWQCTICNVRLSSTNLGSMRRHKLSHMKYKSYQCRLCSASLRHRGGLINHLRVLHLKGTDDKIACPHCPKTFYSLVQYNLHLRTHDENKEQMQETKQHKHAQENGEADCNGQREFSSADFNADAMMRLLEVDTNPNASEFVDADYGAQDISSFLEADIKEGEHNVVDLDQIMEQYEKENKSNDGEQEFEEVNHAVFDGLSNFNADKGNAHIAIDLTNYDVTDYAAGSNQVTSICHANALPRTYDDDLPMDANFHYMNQFAPLNAFEAASERNGKLLAAGSQKRQRIRPKRYD